MKIYHVTNIIWDMDDDDRPEDFNLPKSCLIEAECDYYIADALSDKYGFCIVSFFEEELTIPYLYKLAKIGKLHFDFSKEEDFDSEEEDALIKVEQMCPIGEDSEVRSDFPRASHKGSHIIMAPDVDFLVFKDKQFKIDDNLSFFIKDIGYHSGDMRLMTITD